MSPRKRPSDSRQRFARLHLVVEELAAQQGLRVFADLPHQAVGQPVIRLLPQHPLQLGGACSSLPCPSRSTTVFSTRTSDLLRRHRRRRRRLGRRGRRRGRRLRPSAGRARRAIGWRRRARLAGSGTGGDESGSEHGAAQCIPAGRSAQVVFHARHCDVGPARGDPRRGDGATRWRARSGVTLGSMAKARSTSRSEALRRPARCPPPRTRQPPAGTDQPPNARGDPGDRAAACRRGGHAAPRAIGAGACAPRAPVAVGSAGRTHRGPPRWPCSGRCVRHRALLAALEDRAPAKCLRWPFGPSKRATTRCSNGPWRWRPSCPRRGAAWPRPSVG